MKDLIKLTEQWARERGIFDKSTPEKQTLKMCSEAGEVADAVAKGDDVELELEIGDVIVTLILLCEMKGLDLDKCLFKAYNKISQRSGKMENGVFIKEQAL